MTEYLQELNPGKLLQVFTIRKAFSTSKKKTKNQVDPIIPRR